MRKRRHVLRLVAVLVFAAAAFGAAVSPEAADIAAKRGKSPAVLLQKARYAEQTQGDDTPATGRTIADLGLTADPEPADGDGDDDG